MLPGPQGGKRVSFGGVGAGRRPFLVRPDSSPHLSARAESAPPPRMGIARPGRSLSPAPRARGLRRIRSAASRRSTAGRGRIRRLAASAPPSSEGPIGPRETAARRRRKGRRRNRGGSKFGGSGFANPGIGGLPEALDVRRPLSRKGGPCGNAAIEPANGTLKKGLACRRASADLGRLRREPNPCVRRRSGAGTGRVRRWAASAPPSSGMRDCPRGKRLASRRESAAGSDAPSSLAISATPSPSSRRRLIYEMVDMPTISLPASLGRLPRRRPK